MNQLTLKEKFDVAIPKEKIELLKQFYEMKARAKVYEDEIKAAAEEFLRENNLLEEGYSQDGITLAKTKDYTKKVLDTDALKEEGIYDLYLKESTVKGHIKISFDYDD